MSEEEILNHDLYTIYKLIEIHGEANGVKTNKKTNKIRNSEVYIDNIKF